LAAGAVRESGRELPVVRTVDLAVVGGGTAAVAAAVAAAEAGAGVVVLAPRPYLGEDLCAPFRLWLEPGEVPQGPLEQALFQDRRGERGLKLTYRADVPSAGRHMDSEPPGMLTDGQWGTAFTESVEYGSDVRIVADLGSPQEVREVRLMVFHSPRNYEVGTVSVSISDDGSTWRDAGALTNPSAGKGSWVESALALAVPVEARARHVRVHFTRAEGSQRILLGELQVHGPPAAAADPGGVLVVSPMQVKRVLEEALLAAGVEFLYGCYATDTLSDGDGALAGVAMVNRAGRQAVLAKVVLDATDRAWLARSAGARFAPYPEGPRVYRRVVVGGESRQGPGVDSRRIALAAAIGGRAPTQYGSGGFSTAVQKINAPMAREHTELIEYSLRLTLANGSYRAFAAAEQQARDLTWHPDALDASETLFEVPPDALLARRLVAGPWPGAAALDLDACRPAGMDRLYILGACAGVSREAAAVMVRPLEWLRLGVRVGQAAAAEARQLAAPADVRLRGAPQTAATALDTREERGCLRPSQRPLAWVPAEPRTIPVLGEYDVVVAGGGTSGAPAAIAAARQGARTLVLEYLTDLGGVGTTGMIGVYCAGYREGFTAEVEAGIRTLGSPSYVTAKQEYWRREIRQAGGDIWTGVLACGAVVDQGTVKGVVVATPEGRGVVLAGTVVDATGNGDVAIAAGAEALGVGAESAAMQGTGLPQREIGATYINTDWTYVDENDLEDVRSALITAKRRAAGAWDLGQLIDTRERRRVLGDYVMSPLDIITQRTFADTIGISQGGKLDSHGFTIHPYYLVNNHHGGIAYTPYRCLLPKGLDGLLVVGLAVSAHRDAIPSLRMQPCMQNLGYAAGCAAALAARLDGATRAIDVRALQRHLVEMRCLTPEVPTHTDSYPLTDPVVRAAVEQLAATDYTQLAIVMASWDAAQPLVRAACRSAPSAEGRLRCAHVLGLMGDPTGADVLAAAVTAAAAFDSENIDTYFPSVTWLDSYIIALGRTRDPRSLPVLLAKLALLNSGAHRFSHFRAVAEALEHLGDPSAAGPLAELLRRQGLANAVVTVQQATVGGVSRGRGGIQNLILARALYRCGDWEGTAQQVLEAYAGDVRGLYARHAQAVLALRPGEPTRPAGWLGL
jgi:flavin-dependent dehydrogenase